MAFAIVAVVAIASGIAFGHICRPIAREIEVYRRRALFLFCALATSVGLYCGRLLEVAAGIEDIQHLFAPMFILSAVPPLVERRSARILED